ncbi:MAG: phage tail protein I [Rhizobiales bacterium]|nr:phage tail protein I [Hyphomicrobiales bacterium]
MTASLVPSNHRHRERALAAALEPLRAIDPAAIETLWDAWRCPADFLPVLAYALSVDFWDDAWDEIQKRQTIADSPDYHRRKGTRAAVEGAAVSAGLPASITEWWQRVPQGRRGTASIHIEAPLDQVAAIIIKVRPRLYAAKPKSRAIFLGAGEAAGVQAAFGAAILVDEAVTVDPYAFAAEDPEGAFVAAIGIHIETLTTIEPAP